MNPLATRLNRLQKTAGMAGILFLLLSICGALLASREFFISWLVAYVFWFGLTLGCFLLALIYYLTGGQWGDLTRRLLEAGFMNLPLMAILFLPLLMGLHQLYPWANPAVVAANKILAQKASYNNFTAFLVRNLFYFGFWLALALRLRKWSLRQDISSEPLPLVKMRTLSGPGICLVPLVATFAFVDWIMSLETAWYSTIFPVILLAGQILIALAFVILLLARFQPHAPFSTAITEKACHDLGNLLLAFVMFWTYVAFSQFLIAYSGNLPAEIGWYLHRTAGGWKWLMVFIALFHFFFPFLVLLLRTVKKNIRRLAWVAGLLFFVHALTIFWAIVPSFYPGGIHVHWLNLTVWLAIGGLWLAGFAWNLKRHPLLAVNPKVSNQPQSFPVHAQ